MNSRKTAAKETNYSLDKYYQNLLSYSVNSDSSSAKKVLDSFVHWPEINNMKCNTDKSKEVSTINLRCSRALPSVRGIEQLKDGAYYCYCAFVLRISRYSDFLSPMLTNTGIFLRGLKLSGESRS